MDSLLPQRQPSESNEVQAALKAIFCWNYDDDLDSIRALYAKGLNLQWNAARDLDWGTDIDIEAFSATFTMGGVPIHVTRFWQGLPYKTRREISRRSAAFTLSNFLHGEQGALLIAGQLVNAVPHMDGKFYAAVQTVDEARHLEVFSTYIRRIDEIRPIAPGLKLLLDKTITSENWMFKCVGMQIVVEGLALFSFRDMRNATTEPLLRKLLTYVSQDEARHTAFGIAYLASVVSTLPAKDIMELEDFGFEATRLLLDSTAGADMRSAVLDLWREAGVDPIDVLRAMAEEAEAIGGAIKQQEGRRSAITAFVLPTMHRIGLLSDRIARMYEQLFDRVRAQSARPPSQHRLHDRIPDLPGDLESWAADLAT